MKLEPHTYKAWWDLHAWAGVLVSLIAYVMFFFGTITLFHNELAIWQAPTSPVPSNEEVDRVLDAGIAQKAIAPETMRLFFPRPGRPQVFTLSYKDPQGEGHYAVIERTGLVEPRSNVADFLYGMHYLQFPSAPGWLYTVAGLASGVLLLALVTGMLIHLRDLVRQLHQFRPHKRLQVIWSDSHKVLGTMGLPFAAVYAFTGAWMGLDGAISPLLARAAFRGDERALSRAFDGPEAPKVSPAQVASARISLAELRALAEQAPRTPGRKPREPGDCRSAYLNHVGDREATALFFCADHSFVFRQRDGSRILGAAPEPLTLARRISDVPYALHFVEFAKAPLRVLYALLGLAGSAAILTGNWLWLARRVPSPSTWVLQRLTLMVGAGSLVATAGMLFVNRFAVSSLAERRAFWWVWFAVCVLSTLGKDARRHWRGLIAFAGLTLAFVPFLGSWRDGAVERSVNAALLGLGVSLLWLAWSLRGWARATLAPSSARVAEPTRGAHVA